MTQAAFAAVRVQGGGARQGAKARARCENASVAGCSWFLRRWRYNNKLLAAAAATSSPFTSQTGGRGTKQTHPDTRDHEESFCVLGARVWCPLPESRPVCDGREKVSVACPGPGGEVGGGPAVLLGRRLRPRWGDETSPRWHKKLYKLKALWRSVVLVCI